MILPKTIFSLFRRKTSHIKFNRMLQYSIKTMQHVANIMIANIMTVHDNDDAYVHMSYLLNVNVHMYVILTQHVHYMLCSFTVHISVIVFPPIFPAVESWSRLLIFRSDSRPGYHSSAIFGHDYSLHRLSRMCLRNAMLKNIYIWK